MAEYHEILESNLETELADAEASLQEAADRFNEAKVRLALEARKYAALRDLALENGFRGLDGLYEPLPAQGLPAQGRFRFIEMKAGDAIQYVLGEEPAAIWGIISKLSRGGWGFPDYPDARTVTAAISRLANVEKVGDDKWRRKPVAGVDVADLPFE